MYTDEVQRTYENEVEPLSLRETRPTVQLIRMAANASPMQAQVGSFIQPQVYSSLLDNIRQVLVVNGVMAASAVLTNEVILANVGLLAKAAAVKSWILAIWPVLAPILPWVLGAVGVAVLGSFIYSKVKQSDQSLMEELLRMIVSFFGNSTSMSMSIEKDVVGDLASEQSLILQSFDSSLPTVHGLSDFTGEIGLTLNGSKTAATFDLNWTRRKTEPSPLYLMIYSPYAGEYHYANTLGTASYPNLVWEWQYVDDKGSVYGQTGTTQIFGRTPDLSDTHEAQQNGDAMGMLQALENTLGYPIYYSETGDIEDLADLNNEMRGYVTEKRQVIQDTLDSLTDNYFVADGLSPSSIVAEYKGQFVELNSNRQVVSSETGQVLNVGLADLTYSVDDELAGEWYDSTFLIDGTDYVWDRDGTGEIKDRQTGDTIFDGLSVPGALWDEMLDDLTIELDQYDIDGEPYIYDFKDLIMDELTPSGGGALLSYDKWLDYENEAEAGGNTITRGHTIRRHMLISDAQLKNRAKTIKGKATVWRANEGSVFIDVMGCLYFINIMAVKGRKQINFEDEVLFGNNGDVLYYKGHGRNKSTIYYNGYFPNHIIYGFGYDMFGELLPLLNGVSIAIFNKRLTHKLKGDARDYIVNTSYLISE